MKKFLPKSIRNPHGFTLIELLIVITILAVLATIGFAVYSSLNTGPRARNAVRRADLDSIAKALEINKVAGGNYQLLLPGQFSNSAIPEKDPLGNLYCANNTSTIPGDLTGTGKNVADCAPATYGPVGTANPPVGASWKICTWLEDEDGAGTASSAKPFCKINAQ